MARVFAGAARAGAARAGAALVRWGGDEFLLILPRAGEWEAEAAARRLRDLAETGSAPVGFSGGVAAWRPGDTVRTLVERVDEAMYREKRRPMVGASAGRCYPPLSVA